MENNNIKLIIFLIPFFIWYFVYMIIFYLLGSFTINDFNILNWGQLGKTMYVFMGTIWAIVFSIATTYSIKQFLNNSK